MTEPEWRRLNRANWDERVPLHLASRLYYDQSSLRAGTAQLDPIVSEALGLVAGMRILHLQCHFGMDSLALAQRGAHVTGVDFSAPAIESARSLAAELGLGDRVRFVVSDVYESPDALAEPACFDRVLVSWGALCWLPDMRGWAKVIAHFLRPGGWLALAEAHPAAYVFDDRTAAADGRPGWYFPYFSRHPLIEDMTEDYADPAASLQNRRTVEWLHPLGDVITALIEAGLRVDRFVEHDCVAWRMFRSLTQDGSGFYRWPDRPWLPLSFSLRAARPA
ncbi:MAG TPA: class I SAM-dependent methyltransferase [Rhodopila sp.]